MLQIPDNCLAHYEKLPQIKLHNFAEVNASFFGKNIEEYLNSLATLGEPVTPVPDHEAVQFYLFNHLSAMVKERFTRHEVLPSWAQDVMREYKSILSKQGIRMTAYMALITARESRHLGQNMPSDWWNTFKTEFGEPCKVFHDTIHSKDSMSVAKKLMTQSPQYPLGKLFKSIEYIFFEGKFHGGYGGHPWGVIAQTLNQFLDGKISQEMMIDTAYTLAHNNGPMFNKGMLYGSYTHDFLRILDVQRSGQIPELIIEENASYLNVNQVITFNNMCKNLPNEFGAYVDWYKVEKEGGLTDVSGYQAKQDQKYGKTVEVASKKGVFFNGKKAVETGYFKIAPGVGAKIVERIDA